MRVAVYPAAEDASGLLRLIWPAEALRAQGADVEVRYGQSLHGKMDGGHLVGVDHPHADVVVFQRPSQSWFADAIPHLRAQGVATVIELDDDFRAVSSRNVAAAKLHPKLSPARNWLHLGHAITQADLVTVSTPTLAARYGAHGRVTVLPNRIPQSWLDPPPIDAHEGVRVSWSGSKATHPDDLEVTRGAVARAVEETGAGFHVVGTGQGVRDGLRLAAEPSVSGWVPIEDYPRRLAECDVAVAPLEQTLFNQAKSWISPLAWAAAGVPCVMSPTDQYQAIHCAGIGRLARKPQEWRREVARLISDPAWRAEVGGHSRETAEHYVIERGAGVWLDAWARAAELRAKRSRAA